jgi:hypothetical protein
MEVVAAALRLLMLGVAEMKIGILHVLRGSCRDLSK